MAVKPPPAGTEYQVDKAVFLISAVRPDQFPPADRPEVAFAGRSNVGKSTLLNKLLKRRKLARTSKTPGRTQTVNFFDVNHELYFVDLPGYGFARAPVAVQAGWRPMVEGYLNAGRDIRRLVLLIDVRRDPGREEKELLAWLENRGLAALVVVTKADKVKRGRRGPRLSAIKKGLGLTETPLVFSALSGEGREEVWARLSAACGLDE